MSFKTLFNSGVKYFVNPKKQSNITILRSPYRHKLTRHQLTFSRYTTNVSMDLRLVNNLVITKNSQITSLISEIKNYSNSFETNVLNQHRIKIIAVYKYSDFFKLS